MTETPRQHIIRRHILAAPTLVPFKTTYANPLGLSTDELFEKVREYNIKKYLASTASQTVVNEREYNHTFPPIQLFGITYGLIGIDGAMNQLGTNRLYLSLDRCTVDTSFPTPP